jgi:hypothetical protein
MAAGQFQSSIRWKTGSFSRYCRAVAPIQADNVAMISLMTSRSVLPERTRTWKE